jgi:protein-S-isoprenylcysteine O-methyltransferase Ste14
MSPGFRLAFLAVTWGAWMLPFFLFRPKDRPKAVQVARKARWGIALVAFGFWLNFLHTPATWATEFVLWRVAVASVFAAMGILLAWTAIRSLGRQWRVDAGLNADHQMVRTGPYRIVRHPIYAAMLCMFLTGVAAIGTFPAWPVALAFFIAGTEIRVRTEDGLLRGRFAGEFEAWQRAVPAYLPFLR